MGERRYDVVPNVCIFVDVAGFLNRADDGEDQKLKDLKNVFKYVKKNSGKICNEDSNDEKPIENRLTNDESRDDLNRSRVKGKESPVLVGLVVDRKA